MRRENRAFPFPALIFPIVLALFSCSFAYRVSVDPPDATVVLDGARIDAESVVRSKSRNLSIGISGEGFVEYSGTITHSMNPFAIETVSIKLERGRYPVRLESADGKAAYLVDGSTGGTTPFVGDLESGWHRLTLIRTGGEAWDFDFEVRGRDDRYVFRPQPEPIPLRPIGVFKCGPAPKQVTFSPDGNRLYIALLGGKGFQVLDRRARVIRNVDVAGFEKESGFVEGLFVPRHEAFLVSQMTTDRVHEFLLRADGGERYARSIPSGGTWTKVVAYSPDLDVLAVSNWVSNDVSIIDYASGRVLKMLRKIPIPRGLAFGPGGDTLYVASFGAGLFQVYDTTRWAKLNELAREGGALRHVVALADGGRIFVDDMSRNEVLEIDARSFGIKHVYPTEDNPNTIDLTRDGRILAISCRGPNNPKGYTLRSPAPGAVLIYDTRSKALVARVAGGTQPTGLDISDDDRWLAFSNFQDASVEIYSIEDILPKARRLDRQQAAD